MSEKHRYVEVCTFDGARWRAVVPRDPVTVQQAERLACQEAASEWGIPERDIQVFVTRTVSPEKHAKLMSAVERGTLDPDWWLTNRRHVEV